MIRVLQFGMSNNKGGIETFIFNNYAHIDHNKIQFDFVKMFEGKMPYEEEILSMGGRIFEFFPCGYTQSISQNRKQWMEFYDKVKPDVIHYNTIALTSLRALYFAKKSGVKHIYVHAHPNRYYEGMSLKNRFSCEINRHLVYLYADKCLACSEQAGKWMYSKDFQVIPNAIDTERFAFNESKRNKIRRELDIENKIVICNVGNLSDVKNQTFLLDIALELKKKWNIAILLLGTGSKENLLKEKAKRLGISREIFFLGNVENVEEYLSASDLFVFPSKSEGFGIVLLEAQANGLQCFASDKVIPKATNAADGITFLPLDNNASFWAEKIIKNYKYHRLEETKIHKLKEQYDIKDCIKKLQEMYLEG